MHAAVEGGAVVSFVAGLEGEDKIDVLSSIQIAQRAAKARFDRFADTKGWYGAFVEVLEQLGWVIDAFAFTERDQTRGARPRRRKTARSRSAPSISRRATIAAGSCLRPGAPTKSAFGDYGDSAFYCKLNALS
jgi:hypothetical protein